MRPPSPIGTLGVLGTLAWLGIPYARADCVRLTRLYLRARGVRTRDPRLYPEAWQPATQANALAVTYKNRGHIAPIADGYVIEARKGRRSFALPLARMLARVRDVEFWRPC